MLKVNYNILKYAITSSWDIDTCHPDFINKYKTSDISTGQCAISALILNDYLGGTIQSGYIKELNIKHYWNIIEGEIIDFTKNQFDKNYEYLDIKNKSREEILKNEDTNQRYLILKNRVDEYLNRINEILELIKDCNKCVSMVEKFEDNPIYFGKRSDILFVGEAPAPNGWRKSGLIWRDINGKFLPSAKVLQKLMDIIDIDILDISFIEAVKCFPKERKYLKACSNNCESILQRCILALNPKYIITLGEYPIKLLLKSKDRFANLVGKKIEIKIEDSYYQVIPIYHPSPISPKSYNGNKPIFEFLDQIIG